MEQMSDSPQVYSRKSDRYARYRDALLSCGFSEAKQCCGKFLLPTTENAAFIVNLEEEEYGVNVVYGFASVAGGTDWFFHNGVDNETCQVRNILFISDDIEAAQAAYEISALYHQYKTLSKDEILAVKKERQKIFLSHFARALKPLGFKKKGATWTKKLRNDRTLSLEAQKSAYSDQFYFNVSVYSDTNPYKRDFDERVVMYDSDIYNWQLMSDSQIENLIQYTLKTYIHPNIEGGS